jgi:MFS family permease
MIESQHSCDNESATQRNLRVGESPSPFRALLVPRIMIIMSSYAFFAFVDMSIQVLLPLVCSTSVPLGGLGFDPYRIGTIMGTWGFINAFFQGFLLGPTIRRFGSRKCYIASQMNLVVIIGLYPLLTSFARRAGRVDAKVWVVLVVQLILQMSSYLAYGASYLGSCLSYIDLMSVISGSAQIFIVNSAARGSLGATTGMAQAVSSTMRSIAPTVASSLFSISLQRKLAGGNMVYFILIGIALVGVRVSLLLPKDINTASRDE